MTEVERSWFRRRFADEPVARPYKSEHHPDADLDEVAPETAEADYATFIAELELARAATAGHGLEETFVHERLQEQMNLRWAYVHMIEECARHCGHADLIRERVDGATGS